MADIVREDVLLEAQRLHDLGDIAGAYGVLAAVGGDAYALSAWMITNDEWSTPQDMALDIIVAETWALGAPGLYDVKFELVAAKHQQNYLDEIKRDPINVNGVTFYNLPNTYEIEMSYYKALIRSGVPASAAIDLVLNKYTKGFVSWSYLLDLEASRKSPKPFDPKDFAHGGKCFPATTPIAISPTKTRPISQIRVGDTVLAFDPAADLGRGALVPRKVVRLYRNTTEEWVKLTWTEGGDAKKLVATPGHHFLDRFGSFPTIEDMLENGKATVVLASGELTTGEVGNERGAAA